MSWSSTSASPSRIDSSSATGSTSTSSTATCRTSVFSTEPRDVANWGGLDLAQLVDIITQEVVAASRRPDVRCVCHAVNEDCCPGRLQGVLDAGAVRLGVHAQGGAPASVAGLIDHTLLKPDATREDLEKLCREAAEFHFATVCVNPTWVALSAQLLRGSGVGVCTVVGFPLGATTADVKHYETRRAIFDGAVEIDMVINVGALKSGDY